ncbi:MAG TPA: beta-galactosidase [Candidatus Polarisedimenticolia bacterium]|nr:beta-galactosidase [Candidatus Polarisedimenticolia bacterium]
MRHKPLARFTAAAILFSVGLISSFAAQTAAKQSGKAAQNTTQSNGVRLPEVHLDGAYFTRDGKRFIPMGAHWVPAKTAMQWPVQWDPKDIEADFAKMHELGYSIVRLDVMWAWFEPRPGDYNPVAFQQLDYLVSLAHKYQIYLHPSLFIGGEVGEAYWDVPWRHGRHPHADPEMLRLETNLAAEFGRHYANESAIIGWDLTDEPPFWIVGRMTTDAMAVNWTRLIVDGVREYDKLHPVVVGTSGEEITHGPFRADNIAKFVDFLSVHPFTLYAPDLFPDALLSARGTYGAAFEITLSQGAGRPVMIHEMGASTAQFSPERIASYDRAQIYSGIGAGSIGVDLWCYTDASPEQFHKVPYLRTPQETGWGMTSWDRQDKPLAREFKKFSQVVGQLDLTGIAPAPADIGIVIPDEWAKAHGDFSHFGLTGPEVTPYVSTSDGDAMPGRPQPDVSRANQWLMSSALTSFILARRASLKADFPREYADWAKRPMLFMPSPITSTADPFLAHVHSDFYEKVKQYVENGGFLYASVASDGSIPDMASLFGVRLVDRAPSSEVTLKIVAPFGDLKPGDTFHYSVPTQTIESWGTLLEVTTGKVIAVDQNNRPALVANTLGRGKSLLSAYPLEHYLANVPSVFDQPEKTHRIYKAFGDWVGLKPAFRTDQPSVEVSALNGDHRGYVVLVNHSAEPQKVTVFTTSGAHSVSRIAPEGVKPMQIEGSSWKMELGSYEGAIVEWK